MPDGTDGRGRHFQTKMFIEHPTGWDGNKWLEITEDGRFIQTRGGWDDTRNVDGPNYTGIIEFYDASGPPDGYPLKHYVATIGKGVLTKLETSHQYYARIEEDR